MKNDKQQMVKPRTKKQWELHQQIARFVKDLDRLPDAVEVQRNPPRSAPLNLLPMVF